MKTLIDLLITQTSTLGDVPTSTAATGGGVVDPYTQISDYLLQTNMYLVAAAIYLLPGVLGKIPGIKALLQQAWVARALPFYPLGAACIATFLPGALKLPDDQIGTRIVAMVWLAGLSMVVYKIIGQTVLGNDRRLQSPVEEGYKPSVKEDS